MNRFAITYVGKHGLRTLVHAAQARHMHDTREEAERSLAGMLKTNGAERLEQIYGPGKAATLRVDEFECWDSGDPKGVYVDD